MTLQPYAFAFSPYTGAYVAGPSGHLGFFSSSFPQPAQHGMRKHRGHKQPQAPRGAMFLAPSPHHRFKASSQAKRAGKRHSRAGKGRHAAGGHGATCPPSSMRVAPGAPEHVPAFVFSTPRAGCCNAFTPAPSFVGTSQPGDSAPHRRFWRNGLGTMSMQAAETASKAGIDMFGTNAGCAPDDDHDPYGFDLDTDQDGDAPVPEAASTSGHVERQSAYIAQLEETNLKLQHKIYELEQELHRRSAARAGGRGSAQGSGDSSREEEADGDGVLDQGGAGSAHGSAGAVC